MPDRAIEHRCAGHGDIPSQGLRPGTTGSLPSGAAWEVSDTALCPKVANLLSRVPTGSKEWPHSSKATRTDMLAVDGPKTALFEARLALATRRESSMFARARLSGSSGAHRLTRVPVQG